MLSSKLSLVASIVIQIALSLIHGKKISIPSHRMIFRRTSATTDSPTSALTEESTLVFNASQSKLFSGPSPISSPIFISTPSNSELAMNQTKIFGDNDLALVKGCTKQLLHFQGDNLGIITGDDIKKLQKTVKSELNKEFTRNISKAQIVNVSIVDQLFYPWLSQDITIVVLIQGSFPEEETFAFDTEVQKTFDVISDDILIQLKENIDLFSDVTYLFSLIDWNSNANEEQCGITTPRPKSSLKSSFMPSPMSSLIPSVILELVERCTKQLLYLKGDNIGIIKDDNIQILQSIVKSELNKIFTRDTGRAQNLNVTVLDQLFNPRFPRDITIVIFIQGSFPNIADFVFDTEVEQIFDVISNILLIELKENIEKYSDVTDLFSVADWSLNAPELQCKKKDENEFAQIGSAPTDTESQNNSKFSLSASSFILIGIAVLVLCFCIPACVVQNLVNWNNQNKDLNGINDYDATSRLAEKYATSAITVWSDGRC